MLVLEASRHLQNQNQIQSEKKPRTPQVLRGIKVQHVPMSFFKSWAPSTVAESSRREKKIRPRTWFMFRSFGLPYSLLFFSSGVIWVGFGSFFLERRGDWNFQIYSKMKGDSQCCNARHHCTTQSFVTVTPNDVLYAAYTSEWTCRFHSRPLITKSSSHELTVAV